VLRVFPILNVIGLVVLLFAFTMLVPWGVSFYYHDAARSAYDDAILITFVAGLLLWLSTRHLRRELKIRDGYLLVVLVWAVLPAFATLPLLIYLPHLSFTDAYFETMSGLSTTGATVLSGLDQLPKSINLWRTLLNWLGGMGVIVLAVAVLPLLGVGGRQLFKAETPGPMKDSKLTPRIAQTAKALWLAYSGITVACIVSLKLAGMSWFDAVCHAFATMGLGGFSTHDASVGYFNSPAIEAVLIVFMLLAAMNFATHFLALSGRSLRVYLTDPEVLPMLGLVFVACTSLASYLWYVGTYANYLTCAALRQLQSGLARHRLRLCQYRFQPVADIRPAIHAAAQLRHRQRRLHRRRYQDDPHATDAQTGQARTGKTNPPQRPAAGQTPPERYQQSDRVRCAGAGHAIHHQHHHAHPGAGCQRAGFRLGVFCHHRLHQQRRSGPE